jgi:hypothetical protein
MAGSRRSGWVWVLNTTTSPPSVIASTNTGSAKPGGRPLHRVLLRHHGIVAGAELRFTMQAQPNKACATTQRHYSMPHH